MMTVTAAIGPGNGAAQRSCPGSGFSSFDDSILTGTVTNLAARHWQLGLKGAAPAAAVRLAFKSYLKVSLRLAGELE
jgi:hypothetical protein